MFLNFQIFLFTKNIFIIIEKKFCCNIKFSRSSDENYIKFRKILYSRFHSRVYCPIMKKPMTNTFISTPLSIKIFNCDFLICFFFHSKSKREAFSKYLLLMHVIFFLNLLLINLCNEKSDTIQTRES